MEFMVLAEFFPSSGVNGVDESAVYGDDIDTYRKALHLGFDEEALFFRIAKARGKAAGWLVAGDVVCRRLGVDEERCDVVRTINDKVFCTKACTDVFTDSELEALRREAIESHRWKVHRDDDWCTVIDPQGRALVVAYIGAFRQWRKVMEQLVPRQVRSKAAKTPVHRASAAWCALKAVHRRFIHEHDAEITRSDLWDSDYMAKDIYEHRLKLGRFAGTGRVIKMTRYRSVEHQMFWSKCFGMLEDGEKVPFAVQHVYNHPSTKWVSVGVDDAEWMLGCSWWPEWKKKGPVRFDKFKEGGKDAGNWK
tara:strand:- start:5589 stop:6509 length:921 start_codon:yes stop_codon:yes gene_type:complete